MFRFFSRPRLPTRQMFGIQSAIFLVLYALGVAAFVSQSEGVTERFSALARGPFLSHAIASQLRILPAYVVLAAVFAFLSRPFLRSTRWWLTALHVICADLFLLLLMLGPVLLLAPGLFDAAARKMPRMNLYALQQHAVLYALSAGFIVVSAIAIFDFVRRPRLLLLIGTCCAILGFAWKSAPPISTHEHGAGPNVLIVATDSWRFDRVGIHGAVRTDITPHIDAFAHDAVDFTNHHVATASTLESWVSFFSSLFPNAHGIRSMYPSKEEVRAVESRSELLPKILKQRGYSTFVSSDWVGNCFDLVDLGFTTRRVSPVQNFEAFLAEASLRAHGLVVLMLGAIPGALGDALIPNRASLTSTARPKILVDQLFDDVDASVNEKKPFFGLLFVSPTHLPYNARAPFNTKYADPQYTGPHRYHVDVSAHELITTGFSPSLSPDTIQHVRDLYDGAVSDFDDTVGDVLDRLEQRKLAQNTIVIVTTDHGEDLYDPGSTLGHGTNFFGGEQSTHIPFFIRGPHLKPTRIDALTRAVDVAPTILSLLEMEIPKVFQGTSFVPLLNGTMRDLGLVTWAETCYLFFPKSKAMLTSFTLAEREQVVELAGAADTLEVDLSFRNNLVLKPEYREAVVAAKDLMVRKGAFKLIEIPGKTQPIRRLYNVESDPLQQVNLYGQGLPQEVELVSLLRKGSTALAH
jgi:Sulfatase